jgi:hypothetical protein
MRKTFVFSLLAMLIFAQIDAATPARTFLFRDLKQYNLTTAYDVRIKLVHTDGSPVTGSIMLRGFWARNVQTGVMYDPTDREGYEFAALPAGTYTFGAYPGPWEGAVSKTVILDGSQEGPDGFTEVTLVYWVE